MSTSPTQSPRSRSRCAGIPVRIAEGAADQDLLGMSLSLAQTQIAGQLAEETSLDSRLMGTLGFVGALLGADIAVQRVLGTAWWVALVPIGLAAIWCLRAVFGVGLASDVDLGPPAAAFYSNFNGTPLTAARQQLLADFIQAFARNAERIRGKRCALRTSVLILAFGFGASTLVIAVDHSPTKRTPHAPHSSIR